MKYSLMDLLACPICKKFPIELNVFEKVQITSGGKVSKCEEYCGYEGKPVSELKSLDCENCQKIEIKEGILICPSCKRWYPIEDDIPRMLPDELRERGEVEFLRKYRDKIPREILGSGKPFNLSSA